MIAMTSKKTDSWPRESTIHAEPKVRLLRLWDLLSNGEAKTPAALAEIFGINTRTINRDLRVLNKAGCNLCFDCKAKVFEYSNSKLYSNKCGVLQLQQSVGAMFTTAFGSCSNRTGPQKAATKAA